MHESVGIINNYKVKWIILLNILYVSVVLILENKILCLNARVSRDQRKTHTFFIKEIFYNQLNTNMINYTDNQYNYKKKLFSL